MKVESVEFMQLHLNSSACINLKNNILGESLVERLSDAHAFWGSFMLTNFIFVMDPRFVQQAQLKYRQQY